MSPVTLTFGDVLYEPGSPIGEVYFPQACLVSLLTLVEGHLALEVGMVGRDGMVGTALALGIKTSPVRALVQGGGAALRMTRAGFLRALAQSPALQRAVSGYIHLLMGQISQPADIARADGRWSRRAWDSSGSTMKPPRPGAAQRSSAQPRLAAVELLGIPAWHAP